MDETGQIQSANFKVEQKIGLIDENIEISLVGVGSKQLVKVIASMRDNLGGEWESYAVFRSNEEGQVNLGTQCPIEGTYSSVDKMGLFWSMVRKSVPPTQRTPLAPIKTILTAKLNDKVVTSTEIVRHVVAPGVKRISVDENGLIGTLFVPSGAEGFPSVIVLGGSEGGLMEGRAAMLASHGFVAFALAYFGTGDLPNQLINIPVEYIKRAIAWMNTQRYVDSERLAVFGTSKGGELALLSGALFPELRAVVAVVPSGVVFRGIGKLKDGSISSSWSKNGKPLPFAAGPITQSVTEDINHRIISRQPIRWVDWYLDQLSDHDSVQKATISVENIQGPVLLVSGGDDQMWPSGILSGMIVNRLEKFRHPFTFSHLHYPKAGHAIVQPYYPTTDRSEAFALGGNPEDDAAAQADSWRKIIQFLKTSF
jgi:dienelactone hydrolase